MKIVPLAKDGVGHAENAIESAENYPDSRGRRNNFYAVHARRLDDSKDLRSLGYGRFPPHPTPYGHHLR